MAIKRFSLSQFLTLRKGSGGRSCPWLVDYAEDKPPRGAALGEHVRLKGTVAEGGGNEYLVIKAAKALTKNRIVSWEPPITVTVGEDVAGDLAADAGDGVLRIDTEAKFATDGARGALALVKTAADTWTWVPIIHSTTTTIQIAHARNNLGGNAAALPLYDADRLGLAFAANDTFLVIRPFHVVDAGTSALTVSMAGLTYCDIAEGKYGLIQTKGYGLIEAAGALAGAPTLLSGNLNTGTGAASTADTGAVLAGVYANVLAPTTGVGVAPVEVEFPTNHFFIG